MTYENKEDRAKMIAEAGVALASGVGFMNITAYDISAVLKISRGTVYYSIGGAQDLRDAILREAVAVENLTVVAQGLAMSDPIATNAPRGLKLRAAELLAGDV